MAPQRKTYVDRGLTAGREILVSMFPLLPLTLAGLVLAAMPPRVMERAAKGHELSDTSGRSIQSPLPAGRIVMFPPVLWEYLAVQRDTSRLVAVSESILDIAGKSVLGRAHPTLFQTPTVVTRGVRTAAPGDPEDVMRHNPDAVLSWDWLSEGLDAVGIPVVHLALNAKNRGDDVHTSDIGNIRVMAALAGEGERGEQIIRNYSAAAGKALDKARAATRAAGRAPRALFLSVRGGGQLYLEAAPFTQGIALAAAGADTAEFRPSGALNAEQLMMWDPDVILLNCCYGDGAGPEYFYDDPRFSELVAVRERRVYKAPSGAARMEGVLEWPYLVSWLVEVLYPHHTDHTVRFDLARAYVETFGYRLSATELDDIFAIKANARSRSYALTGQAGQ